MKEELTKELCITTVRRSFKKRIYYAVLILLIWVLLTRGNIMANAATAITSSLLWIAILAYMIYIVVKMNTIKPTDFYVEEDTVIESNSTLVPSRRKFISKTSLTFDKNGKYSLPLFSLKSFFEHDIDKSSAEKLIGHKFYLIVLKEKKSTKIIKCFHSFSYEIPSTDFIPKDGKHYIKK